MKPKFTEGLRFEIEWLQADGITAEELGATWCRLGIWVGDSCVTLVEDLDTKSLRRSIYGSVYPLAEWIAYSWWFLHADSRRPISFSADDRIGEDEAVSRWHDYHDARASGDGYFWPCMTIEPDGRDMFIRWEPRVGVSQSAAFRSNGQAIVDGPAASEELGRLVDSVIERLDEAGIKETDLQREWSAIRSLDDDEREYCVASARLGFDPFDTPTNAEASILEASTELPEEILDDFLDAITLDTMSDGLDWVRDGANAVKSFQATSEPLTKLPALREPRMGDQLPWEVGYRHARQVRSLFVEDAAAAISDLGVGLVNHKRVEDSALVAIGGELQAGSVAVAYDSNNAAAETARFVQARAIWFAAHPKLKHQFLITNLAGNQRIARAFAAELLAPAAGIREFVKNPRNLLDESTIDRIAQHFQVSGALVRHQVQNQIIRSHSFSM